MSAGKRTRRSYSREWNLFILDAEHSRPICIPLRANRQNDKPLIWGVGVRQSSEPGPALEALLDARDDLHVKISLAADLPGSDPDTLDAMFQQVKQLEREIQQHWKRRRPEACAH